MWLVCGIVSVVFCILGLIMSIKKNAKSMYVSICSLVFVVLTLLMEYKIVLDWVNKEDWVALLDVVPSMYSMLTGYVIVLLLVNIVVIGVSKNHQ